MLSDKLNKQRWSCRDVNFNYLNKLTMLSLYIENLEIFQQIDVFLLYIKERKQFKLFFDMAHK